MSGQLKSLQLTTKHYRALGYKVYCVEYFARGRRHDLLGFLDAIAFGDGKTIGLQACGGGDFAEHYRKITHACARNAGAWLSGGNEIHLVGWRKLKDGKIHPRIEIITTEKLT